MGSMIGHRIDYNAVGALRGQRHIHSKNLPKKPPPPPPGDKVLNPKIMCFIIQIVSRFGDLKLKR